MRPSFHLRARAAVPVALASALALSAASADAATLGLDQRCYVAGEQATVSGSGFLPRTAVAVTRADEQVIGPPADNSGAFRRGLLVPEVTPGLAESQVEIMATDGVNTARAFLNVATVGAAFTPSTGNPRTLTASHEVSGFGLAEVKPSIYLHYVSPAAQRAAMKTATGGAKTGGTATPSDPPGVKTIRLGQLRGACGVLKTSPRKLFPFRAENGSWLLQFDTRPRYTRGTSGSSFLWVSRKVTIQG